MRQRVFGFVIMVLLLTGCGVSNTKVTKENYDKLKTGMTYEQVTEIMGKADTNSESDMGEFGKAVALSTGREGH
jgi:hypothetical protein